MPSDITLEEIRRMAGDAGLTRLTDEHLEQLRRATQAARQRRGLLPDARLAPSDEPAHVYCIDRHAAR